jgi:hypothetical protein
MDVRVPRALWDQITNFDAQVWDGAAQCTMSGFGMVQGAAQMEQHQMFGKAGGQADFTVTAGIPNTYYVAGYDATNALVAAGCQRATVGAGGTLTLTIVMGPPDSMGGNSDNCSSGAGEFTNGHVDNQMIDAMKDDTFGSCGGMGGKDAVWHFRLDSTQRVVVRSSAEFAHFLYIRSSCADGTSELARGCIPADASNNATIDIPTLNAGDYYVWIDSAAMAATGHYSLSYTTSAPINPPSNDTCAGAKTLVPNNPALTGETLLGAADDYQGSCNTAGGAETVYSFDTTSLGHTRATLVASPSPTAFSLALYVQSMPCGTGAEQGCINAGAAGPETLVIPDLPPGQYFAFVESVSGGEGTYNIGLTTQSVSANNQCAYEQTLAPGTTNGTLVNSTNETAGSCGGANGSDNFYTFTLASPQRVQLQLHSTGSPAFTPVLYLRDHNATCDGTEVACAVGGGNGTASLDILDLAAGTYDVIVDNAGSTNDGTYSLTYLILPVAPPNDFCSAAQTLVDGAAPVAGTTVGADNSVTLACAAAGPNVYYAFTLVSEHRVRVSLTNATAAQAVYVIDSCGSTVVRGCSTSGTLDILDLPAGPYVVVVGAAASGASGTFDIAYQTFPAIRNDTCSTPTTLVDGSALVGENTVGANDDYSTTCGGIGQPDVAYQFTLATRRQVQVAVSNSTFNGEFYMPAVGTCGPDSSNGCFSFTNGGGATANFRSLNPGTYSVIVDGASTAPSAGTFNILMSTTNPPPAGDTCIDAPPVLPVGVTYTDTLADGSANDTSGTCGGATGADKVQTFSLASSAHVTLTANSTGSWPFVMYLRQGAQCSTASQVSCVASSSGSAQIDITSLAAGTYWVWIDATSASVGTYSILLQESGAITPPPNDTCSGAITLLPGNQNGTLVGATDNYMGSCNATGGADVVYTFTLNAASAVTIAATPGVNTNNLAVYLQSGTCGTGTEVKCQNTSATGTETLQVDNLAPGTYFVFVEGVGPISDTFALNFTTGPPVIPPGNDNCSSPTSLSFTGSPPTAGSSGTLVNGTDDAAGSCGGGGQPDVVYLIPQSAFAGANKRIRAIVTSSTASPGTFDPVIYLRSTCAGAEIGCAQTRTDQTEVLDLANVAPGNYFLWVDKMGGPSNTFSLNVQLLAPVTVPGNDTCSAPAALTPAAFTNANAATAPTAPTSGSTVGGNDDYTLSCDPISGRDVVYSVALAAASQVVVDVEPVTQFYTPAYSLRTQANCANTTDVACNLGPIGWTNCRNQAAGTYDVIVDGEQGSVGDFTIKAYSGAASTTGFGYAQVDVPAVWNDIVPQGANLLIDVCSVTTCPIGGTGTRSVTRTLPFDVVFYGQTYLAGSNFTVYEPGYIAFDNSVGVFNNVCAPNAAAPNNLISPMWDDFGSRDPNYGGRGRVYMLVTGNAPDRQLIVQWDHYDFWQTGNHYSQWECEDFSVQAIIYENGDIEFQYQPFARNLCSGPNSPSQQRLLGAQSTIAIENSTGNEAIQRFCNAATTDTSAVFGQCCGVNAGCACPTGTCAKDTCWATKGFHFVPPRCTP